MIKNRFLFILILGALSAIGPLSIDMYLPGFLAIAKELHTSTEKVAYSLSGFFVGICFGQLLFGPLLDRFGRKRPLLAGILIYIIASVGCSYASSIWVLVICRFFQAIGACAGLVTPRAIVRDLFPVKDIPGIFSLLVLVLGVSPIIAPSIGSFIVSTYNWQRVFVVLAGIGALLLVCAYRILPESRKPDPSVSLELVPIVISYWKVGKSREFYVYAFINALSASAFYCYLAGSPVVFMHFFRVSEKMYGYIFSLIAIGLIGGSQLNVRLLKRYTSHRLMGAGLLIQGGAGLLLIIVTVLGLYDMVLDIFLIFLFFCCQGLIAPNATALSLQFFPEAAGIAAALLGAMQMGAGAMATALVGSFAGHTAFSMVTGMFACCAMGSWLFYFKQNQYK